MIIKPKFWNKNGLKFFSFLLLPLTIPIRINNFYHNHKKKYKSKKIFSICVGNIYLGGTGKTPTTIKLFEILNKINKATTTAKKFYKNQRDEIILLKNKTRFLTGLNRIEIVAKAVRKNYKIIIFDDGLQEKDLEYNLKLVCFDTLDWIGNGNLIPSGPLREKLSSLERFDAIFLKNINRPNYKIIDIIKKINPKIKVFNSNYKIKILKKFNLSKKYIIFSGIGNPDNFDKLLKKNKFKIIQHFKFPDHHEYSKNDIKKIIDEADKLNVEILTTEKDHIKIPKIYHKKIKKISVDLEINNQKKLIQFLKLKIKNN